MNLNKDTIKVSLYFLIIKTKNYAYKTKNVRYD